MCKAHKNRAKVRLFSDICKYKMHAAPFFCHFGTFFRAYACVCQKNIVPLCPQFIFFMKKRIFFYAALMAILCACEEQNRYRYDDDDDDYSGKPKTEQKFAAVHINDSTPDADILLACYDGSYILFDVNKEDKCGILHINSSFANNLEDGFTICIDSTGLPWMVQVKEGEFLFKNVTDSTCDMAFKDTLGNISYYWGLSLWGEEQAVESVVPRKMPASLISQITYPFTTWWSSVSNFDWTWDDAQRKAILPYMLKVASFAITGVGVILDPWGGSLSALATLAEESAKSELISPETLQYINGVQDFLQVVESKDIWKAWYAKNMTGLQFASGKLGLSIFASQLNHYADNMLNNIAVFEEQTEDIYLHPEFQLRLSTYLLECSPKEKDYDVAVDTKAYWTIDAVQSDWCSASRVDNTLRIHVEEYDGVEDRICTVTIRTLSDNIPTATLTVKQSGVVFELYPTELTFIGKKSSRGVAVTANSNVLQWRITSMPTWLQREESTESSFFLSVISSYYNPTSTQTGVVTVEATLAGGVPPVTRTISVQWVPANEWDNTRWHFSGNITTSGYGDSVTNHEEFDLLIHSVSNNSGEIVVGGFIYRATNITEEDSNHLHCNFSYTYDNITVNWTFSITRTGDATATGEWNTSQNGVTQHGTLSGTLTGTANE